MGEFKKGFYCRECGLLESGKGEFFFSPPPHITWHAGPHQEIPKGYRAVAG